MSRRSPLTIAERVAIYEGKLVGKTLAEVAVEVKCSLSSARKWWRRGHMEGCKGVHRQRRGRSKVGILCRSDPRVIQKALAHKRCHVRWGARRVLVELQCDPELHGLRLPHASRLAAFFKDRCPDCVATPHPQRLSPRPPQATGAHEIWQLDSQEGIRLLDGQIATICNIRDPVGAAMIASQAFEVKTVRHWRKLTVAEVRELLRSAFAEWKTMPEVVVTDHELGLAGSPTDFYPSLLTLWLAGLGIPHIIIRPSCPTDQAQVERNHRTLDNLALDDTALANQGALQSALDHERHQYNHSFPSRASDCAGRPPLVAHPELLRPRRPYQRECELALFDLQRTADYLARFTFPRKVNTAGQISLGRRFYSVGRAHAGQTVQARFDPHDRQWVMVTSVEDEEGQPMQVELARRPPIGFDVATITGLDPEALKPAPEIQLSFPFFSTCR